jgi:hypothetical protein
METGFNERRSVMSKKIGSIEILACLCLAMIVLAGCASSKVNLVDTERVTIERMASEGGVRIENVYVYQEGNELLVSGRVKRRGTGRVIPRGHVDIAILSPEGNVIEKASTSYVPTTIRRKLSHRGSHFNARFSVVPPEGSTVRVSYHARGYSAARTTFDCGENSAVNPL